MAPSAEPQRLLTLCGKKEVTCVHRELVPGPLVRNVPEGGPGCVAALAPEKADRLDFSLHSALLSMWPWASAWPQFSQFWKDKTY